MTNEERDAANTGPTTGPRYFRPTFRAYPVTTKAPSEATMYRWMDNGIAKATDGCKVEPDGRCPHGAPSWLLHLGLI